LYTHAGKEIVIQILSISVLQPLLHSAGFCLQLDNDYLIIMAAIQAFDNIASPKFNAAEYLPPEKILGSIPQNKFQPAIFNKYNLQR